MNGTQALEALERAVESRYAKMRPVDTDYQQVTLYDIRAALAEPAAVPEGREAYHDYDAMTNLYGLTQAQYDRLRAWQAWGREHAVKAMQKVKPIVGAAVAASNNKARPLREAAYTQLVGALAAAPRQEK